MLGWSLELGALHTELSPRSMVQLSPCLWDALPGSNDFA